jgi:hypothetical protein
MNTKRKLRRTKRKDMILRDQKKMRKVISLRISMKM